MKYIAKFILASCSLGIGIALAIYGMYQTAKILSLIIIYPARFIHSNFTETLHYIVLAFGVFAYGNGFVEISKKITEEK